MKAKPVIPYTEVESEYIRQAIEDGSSDDRDYRTYVNELIHIEKFVETGTFGFASGMKHMSLRKRFPEEYAIIHEELDPEGFADCQRRREERKQATLEEEEAHAGELAETRRDWEVVSEGETLPFSDR